MATLWVSAGSKGERSKAGDMILFSAKHIFAFLESILEEYIELTCILSVQQSYPPPLVSIMHERCCDPNRINYKKRPCGVFHWEKLNLSLVSFSPITVNISCLSAFLLLLLLACKSSQKTWQDILVHVFFFCTLNRKCKTVAHLQIIYPCRPNWCRD